MLLLDASALVAVALARGASASTQAAHGTSAAWSLAVQGVEAAATEPCRPEDANGLDALPQVVVSWNERTHGRWREREVQAALTGSALAGAHTTRLAWRAARSCP